MPMQYTAIFNGCKNDTFQMKNYDNFLIFAQNINCGYMYTVTNNLCFRAKVGKMCTHVNPSYTIYIKVECKGV